MVPSTLPDSLLSLLVDPEDKAPLWYFGDRALLYNPRLRRAYAVVNNIPVLLISEARPLDEAEIAALDGEMDSAIETGRTT